MFREMRRKKQALSGAECVEILKKEWRGVLSVLGDDGYPYGVPLDFYFDEAEKKIYFHCAREGHKLDAIARCEKVCFTVYEKGVQRENDWACDVRSVVVFGRAAAVSEPEILSQKLRDFGRKFYPTEEEMEVEIAQSGNRVRLIAITIDHLSGKKVYEK